MWSVATEHGPKNKQTDKQNSNLSSGDNIVESDVCSVLVTSTKMTSIVNKIDTSNLTRPEANMKLIFSTHADVTIHLKFSRTYTITLVESYLLIQIPHHGSFAFEINNIISSALFENVLSLEIIFRCDFLMGQRVVSLSNELTSGSRISP